MSEEETLAGFYDDNDKLEVEFDTDKEEFVRGFQVGQLWQCMELDHDWIEATVYARNAEMIMRICESKDYEFKAEILIHPDNIEPTDWVHVLLTKKSTPKRRKIIHPDRKEK